MMPRVAVETGRPYMRQLSCHRADFGLAAFGEDTAGAEVEALNFHLRREGQSVSCEAIKLQTLHKDQLSTKIGVPLSSGT